MERVVNVAVRFPVETCEGCAAEKVAELDHVQRIDRVNGAFIVAACSPPLTGWQYLMLSGHKIMLCDACVAAGILARRKIAPPETAPAPGEPEAKPPHGKRRAANVDVSSAANATDLKKPEPTA